MISTPERIAVALVMLVAAQGCGLERPQDPPPFDCEAIDRADERFPEECGGGAADAGTDAE